MAILRKAFDASKFVKSATKSISSISTGFNDPKVWISTGSYLLNKLISNDFTKGIPLGKISIVGGEPGSGKSYICSGNIVKNAQDQGVFVVLIDTENALDEAWLQQLGVDTSPEKMVRISASMVNEVAQIISEFVKEYKNTYSDVSREERPKVLFVVDSLGMLMTPIDTEQFDKGDMKGDMGHLPKQLKKLVKNCVNMFGDLDIGMVATNHTYKSQDMFNPDDIQAGGSGPMFVASVVVAVKKGKLKGESKDDPKKKGVIGIRAMVQVVKSRYAKPFEKAEIEIPYDSGLNAYSGLVEFFLNRGVFTKDGNRYVYKDKSGKVHKEFEKNISNELLDQIMLEWDENLYGFRGSDHGGFDEDGKSSDENKKD